MSCDELPEVIGSPFISSHVHSGGARGAKPPWMKIFYLKYSPQNVLTSAYELAQIVVSVLVILIRPVLALALAPGLSSAPGSAPGPSSALSSSPVLISGP